MVTALKIHCDFLLLLSVGDGFGSFENAHSKSTYSCLQPSQNYFCQFFMLFDKRNTQILAQIDMTTHRLELYLLSVRVYPDSFSFLLIVVHPTLRPLLSWILRMAHSSAFSSVNKSLPIKSVGTLIGAS